MTTEATTDATHAEHHHAHSTESTHEDHMSDWGYVKLAILLAAVTAVEVLLSYIQDDLGTVFLPALLILMLFKFFAVVMYFMHLRFDSKIFGWMFYLGLGLATFVYTVALCTFKFFDVSG